MTVRAELIPALDCLRLTLGGSKGNILDAAMIVSLREALNEAMVNPQVRAIVIDAEGKDFCFGASVEEHLPKTVAVMLAQLHGLVMALIEAPMPVLIAAQGRCLGGGLELALAGSRIIAAKGSTFGQPEVKLGLFAPAASVLLSERVRPAIAEDLLITGRTIDASEAFALGVVDELTEGSPLTAALAYVEKQLQPLSRTGLRFACKAARSQRSARLRPKLERLERLYLEELMKTPDALEGLNAFLEKRPAKWAGLSA